MQIIAKVIDVLQVNDNRFTLKCRAQNTTADTAKISAKLRGTEFSIERTFDKNSIAPEVGDIIALTNEQTEKIISQFAKDFHQTKNSFFLGDIDGDGYDEFYCSNAFSHLLVSPIRGCNVTNFSKINGQNLLTSKVFYGVTVKTATGIYFRSRKEGIFSPLSEKFLPFKILRVKTTTLKDSKKFSFLVKKKAFVGNYNIGCNVENPFFELSISVDINDEKADAKKQSSTAFINLREDGIGNTGVTVHVPKDEAKKFSKTPFSEVWALMEDFENDETLLDDSAKFFFVVTFDGIDGGLICATNPDDVIKVWMNKYAIIPQMRVLFKEHKVTSQKIVENKVALAVFDKFVKNEKVFLAKVQHDGKTAIIVTAMENLRDKVVDVNFGTETKSLPIKLSISGMNHVGYVFISENFVDCTFCGMTI